MANRRKPATQNEDRVPVPLSEVKRYREAQRRIAEWTEIKDAARAKIERKMGEHEVGTVAGVPVISWVHTKGENGRFNQAAHKESEPECHARYTEIVGGRQFKVLEF